MCFDKLPQLKQPEKNRTAYELPEPIQPGDVDTVSTRQARKCDADGLCHQRAGGSGVGSWTSTGRDVSEVFK